MDSSRLNKKSFCWPNDKSGNSCKNWYVRACKLLKDYDSEELCDINVEVSKRATLDKILPLITMQFVYQWLVDVNRNESRKEMVRISPLRTYHLNKISN